MGGEFVVSSQQQKTVREQGNARPARAAEAPLIVEAPRGGLSRLAALALTCLAVPPGAEREHRNELGKVSNSTAPSTSQVTSISTREVLTVEFHRVRAGDSLWHIAARVTPTERQLEETFKQIQRMNGMESAVVAADGTLVVPAQRQPLFASHIVQEGETLRSIAKKNGLSLGLLMGLNNLVEEREISAGETLRVFRADPTQRTAAKESTERSQVAPSDLRTFIVGLDRDFGGICRTFESAGSISAFSNASVDPGGASHGCYQIAERTMPSFIRYLKSASRDEALSAERRAVAGQGYERLCKGSPSSKHFQNEWKRLSAIHPNDFGGLQHSFILETHLLPVLKEAQQLRFDITPETAEVFLSMGVQHGKFREILAAAAESIDMSHASTEEQVTALYAARSQYVEAIRDKKIAAIGNSDQPAKVKERLIRKTDRFWDAVLSRFKKEEPMAKALLEGGNG
jgi:LysM repeat protein